MSLKHKVYINYREPYTHFTNELIIKSREISFRFIFILMIQTGHRLARVGIVWL